MSIFGKSDISQIIEEPSILSSDPIERKLARRLRIQRHIEERDK